METLRVHRPRVILHGASGMGQAYVAAAALHHLEGYHVQTLDVANLMSDSTRVSITLPYSRASYSRSVSADAGSRHRPTFCGGEATSTFGSLYSLTVSMVCSRFGNRKDNSAIYA